MLPPPNFRRGFPVPGLPGPPGSPMFGPPSPGNTGSTYRWKVARGRAGGRSGARKGSSVPSSGGHRRGRVMNMTPQIHYDMNMIAPTFNSMIVQTTPKFTTTTTKPTAVNNKQQRATDVCK